MTQEFHLSITPIHNYEYLIRTEQVPDGAQLAESSVIWPVEDWLMEASRLMDDPLMGLLRSGSAEEFLLNGASTHRMPSPSRHSSSDNLIAFGQQLYTALFQGSIQESWMRAQGIAQHQRSRLRFRLGLKGTELHRLPWEVMYAGDRPLASGTGVVFSRYHSSFSVLKSRFPFHKTPGYEAHPPLKILMVLAAPNDQEMLALKQEAEYLQHELQKTSPQDGTVLSAIELTILEQPGREELTQALEHNHYQVLHYAGHSDLGVSGGSLYLVNRKTGLTELLSGDDLAGLLVNNGIRMAVFNSCRGVYSATSEAADQEGNLAEALVRRGIPAVLAMAERIPDDVALHLSRLFYRNLKRALPVDLSLNRTRQGLITSYGSDQLYWALPILYLHPEFDGYVQSIPDSITASRMSLDFPLTGGLDGDTDTALPPIVDHSNSDLPSSGNGRSHLPKPSEQWATDYASILQDAYTDSEPRDSHYFQDEDFVEEDPDLPEEEAVARLVYEVSQSPTVLEPDEPDSLPPNNNPWEPKPSPDYSVLLAPPLSQSTLSPSRSPVSLTSQNNEHVESVNEASLEDVLDVLKNIMGKSTDKMMAAQRAVQSDPTSAEAFTQLGWALFQQGYPKEAKIAYYRAIRLNPDYADAYSRLGVALHQQGEVKEAIQVFNRAVELDSSLGDAPTILRNLLQDDDRPKVWPVPVVSQPQPSLSRSAESHPVRLRKPLLWIGLVAVGLSAIVATRLFDSQVLQFRNWLYSPSPTSSSMGRASPGRVEDWSSVDTAKVQAIAAEQVSQGNLMGAQSAIAALLDRRALQEAATVLQQIPSNPANPPAINFLKGRIIWQQWLAGNKDYSVAQAREFWEAAARDESTALYQNALGFAYYAEGQWDQAEQAWLKALQSSEGTTPLQVLQPGAIDNSTALTSYAGLAMTSLKKADTAPPDQQRVLRAEALKLRQRVLATDSANFQPDALGKNWMWSEKAIQDWRSLLQQS
ncbi:CHAT domain-containing protein [Leptodesmis sp.]|uniref:CHAT domain-containing protein n=1 Tax=Leptodesmis sp. TaxID=3100501 RepID=UPI0040535129